MKDNKRIKLQKIGKQHFKLSKKRELKEYRDKLIEESEAFFEEHNIPYHKFSNIHFRVMGHDFWPTTKRWLKIKEGSKPGFIIYEKDGGYGFETLVESIWPI